MAGDARHTLRYGTRMGKPSPSKLIPDAAAYRLICMVARYLPATKTPATLERGWRTRTNSQLWLSVVGQVCAVGGAAPWESMSQRPASLRAIGFRRLVGLTPAARANAIHGELRAAGIRSVAQTPRDCRKTQALLKNLKLLSSHPGGPRGYIKEIAALEAGEPRLRRIVRDLAHFKPKGARNFLIDLDLAPNALAPDARVLHVLRCAGAKIPRDVLVHNDTYVAFQSAVRQRVCEPARISGIVLDRILLQNYEAIMADLRAA